MQYSRECVCRIALVFMLAVVGACCAFTAEQASESTAYIFTVDDKILACRSIEFSEGMILAKTENGMLKVSLKHIKGVFFKKSDAIRAKVDRAWLESNIKTTNDMVEEYLSASAQEGMSDQEFDKSLKEAERLVRDIADENLMNEQLARARRAGVLMFSSPQTFINARACRGALLILSVMRKRGNDKNIMNVLFRHLKMVDNSPIQESEKKTIKHRVSIIVREWGLINEGGERREPGFERP